MTIGPDGWMHNPQTIEQAYDALRFHCERLEELLEANAEGHGDKALKRSDKAVTVMKVGFKILKKAISQEMRERADLQVWIRHGRIGTGRGYQAEVERAKRLEEHDILVARGEAEPF
jgi:hypothetical protein